MREQREAFIGKGAFEVFAAILSISSILWNLCNPWPH